MEYVELLAYSLIVLVLITIIKFVCKKIIGKLMTEKRAYNAYSFIRIVANMALVIAILIIWGNHVKNVITLISFLSAAFALAIRDVILNWFSGVYIKVQRPIKLEDRIEINGIKGDVVDLSLLSFDVLEISNKDDYGQSTGAIVTFPNSSIFSSPVKNLTKNFKYIWDELEVKIDIDSDITLAKKTLYKIINEIDIVKSIPKKMKGQLSEVNTTYRIYYNYYDPIIYMKIDGNCVVLTLRYLCHPKKARYVNSIVWNKVYDNYKLGNIKLYKDND
jgi:small-conductance mechanosensitive channel